MVFVPLHFFNSVRETPDTIASYFVVSLFRRHIHRHVFLRPSLLFCFVFLAIVLFVCASALVIYFVDLFALESFFVLYCFSSAYLSSVLLRYALNFGRLRLIFAVLTVLVVVHISAHIFNVVFSVFSIFVSQCILIDLFVFCIDTHTYPDNWNVSSHYKPIFIYVWKVSGMCLASV